MSLILATISFFGWGIGDVYGAYLSRKIGGIRTSIIVSVFSLAVSLPALFFFFDEFSLYTPSLLILNIFLAIFAIAGNVSLNIGLGVSNAPIVGTIGATFPLIATVVSVLVFSDPMTGFEILSGVIILAGVLITGLGSKAKSSISRRAIGYGLFCTVSWGIYFSLIRIVMDEVGWFMPNFIAIVLSIIFVSIFYFFSKKDKQRINWSPWPMKIIGAAILSAFLLRVADFSFVVGIQEGLAPIVGPIGGAYPVIFVILAYKFFKDPISKIQTSGIVITLIGIVLLAIGGI